MRQDTKILQTTEKMFNTSFKKDVREHSKWHHTTRGKGWCDWGALGIVLYKSSTQVSPSKDTPKKFENLIIIKNFNFICLLSLSLPAEALLKISVNWEVTECNFRFENMNWQSNFAWHHAYAKCAKCNFYSGNCTDYLIHCLLAMAKCFFLLFTQH